eukprot:1145401-Pelagomonas_calceolata.AAC.3
MCMCFTSSPYSLPCQSLKHPLGHHSKENGFYAPVHGACKNLKGVLESCLGDAFNVVIVPNVGIFGGDQDGDFCNCKPNQVWGQSY